MDNTTRLAFLFYLVFPLSVVSEVSNSSCVNISVSSQKQSEVAFEGLVADTKVRILEVKITLTASKLTEIGPKDSSIPQLDTSDVPSTLKWAKDSSETLLALTNFKVVDMVVHSLATLSGSMDQLNVPFESQVISCSFNALNNTNKRPAVRFASAVLRQVSKLKGTVCYPQENTYRCCEERNGEIICDLDGVNNRWLTIFLQLSNQWPGLIACFLFVSYGLVPLLISWFPSIHKTEQGKRLLGPDNNSPVGLCSIISKYIISDVIDNSWKSKLKLILLLVVILPVQSYVQLVIVVSVSLGKFVSFVEGYNLLLEVAPIFLIVIYIIQVNVLIFVGFDWCSRDCLLCKIAGVRKRDTILEEITHHLVLPFKIPGKIRASLMVKLRQRWNHLGYASTSKRICFMLLLFLISPVIVLLALVFFCILVCITCPLNTVITFGSKIQNLREGIICSFYLISTSIPFALLFMLNNTLSMLTFTTLGIAANLVDFQHHMLYALLVIFYLLSMYSIYTEKYLILKLHLIEICKSNYNDVIKQDRQLVPKIPEELFDIVCRQVMPKGEGACILLINMAAQLFFLFLFFLALMAFAKQVGADLVVKAFLAVFTGSLPRIVVLFFRKTTQRRSEELRLTDRLEDIVKRYDEGNVFVGDGYESI